MTRLEMSITTDYVRDWDSWAGVREWVQNAMDAEEQFNAPMTIDWHNDTLRIENDGVVLPLPSLLLGFTSKADTDLRGYHGEGYKIGTLALIRAGHPVKIRSGDEVWIPSIEYSKKFLADVLVFNIKKGNKAAKRVRVEIGNVTKDEWEVMKKLFLFLDRRASNEKQITTQYGDLLLDEAHRGKIFVKGIYVQSGILSYGYNFNDATLDRDRKLVQHWEQKYKTSWIWKEAAAKRPDLINIFLQLVEEEKEDVRYIGESSTPDVDDDISKHAAAAFEKRHGVGAVPVSNLAESQSVEHLGARGIIVSKSLGAVLKGTVGSVDEIRDSLRKNVKRSFAWGDLTASQKASIEWATSTLSQVCPEAVLQNIDVVEFGGIDLLGQYKDGRALLSFKILDDQEETLATLIHEFAHAHGGDGNANHVAAIERLWAGVVKHLRKDLS